MAIDRIPGVGPTNADIATAVAAPSAAAIAAAVAAPSAATIASAVSAPSAATIAAAVAAPSAATIATQVAASVPTLSQINTSVSNNASPFGGTWTAITTSGTLNNSGVSLIDISSLGGYKRLRFVFWNLRQVSSAIFHYRINGTSSGYTTYGLYHSGFDAAWPTGAQDGSSIMDGTSYVGSAGEQSSSHIIDIYNADSTTSYKYCEFFGYGTKSTYANTPGPIYGRAIFKNTAAVTSLRVSNGGLGFSQGNYAVFGGN